MYTLESLKPLNACFDSEHSLEQSDVEMVNYFVKFIESMRREKPCLGDNIEYTDEYGDYSKNSHIQAFDDEMGRFSVRIRTHVPFVYRNDDGTEVAFHHGGGGLSVSVDSASLTYVGKREKLFAVFS